MVAFFCYFLDFCANIVFWGKMGLFGCFVFKFNKNKENKMKIEKIIYQVVSSELLYIIYIIRYARARVCEQGVGCRV